MAESWVSGNQHFQEHRQVIWRAYTSLSDLTVDIPSLASSTPLQDNIAKDLNIALWPGVQRGGFKRSGHQGCFFLKMWLEVSGRIVSTSRNNKLAELECISKSSPLKSYITQETMLKKQDRNSFSTNVIYLFLLLCKEVVYLFLLFP